MKKTTLISASLLLAFAGCTCGQGWRPNIFTRLHNRIHGVSNVGAPCDAGCSDGVAHGGVIASPAAHGGCESCNAASANYGGYNEQIVDSYEGTPISNYQTAPMINGTQIYPGAMASPNVLPQSARMSAERIVPKPAN
jgi:hypothetical protein